MMIERPDGAMRRRMKKEDTDTSADSRPSRLVSGVLITALIPCFNNRNGLFAKLRTEFCENYFLLCLILRLRKCTFRHYYNQQ